MTETLWRRLRWSDLRQPHSRSFSRKVRFLRRRGQLRAWMARMGSAADRISTPWRLLTCRATWSRVRPCTRYRSHISGLSSSQSYVIADERDGSVETSGLCACLGGGVELGSWEERATRGPVDERDGGRPREREWTGRGAGVGCERVSESDRQGHLGRPGAVEGGREGKEGWG